MTAAANIQRVFNPEPPAGLGAVYGYKQYARDIRMFFQNNFKGQELKFEIKSEALGLINIRKAKLYLRKSELRKKMKAHPELTTSIILNLPFSLDYPIAIFRSATEENSLVVLTDVKTSKGNIMLALKLSIKEEKVSKLIEIKSVYARDFEQYLNFICSGYLLVADEKKIHRFLTTVNSISEGPKTALISRCNCEKARSLIDDSSTKVGNYLLFPQNIKKFGLGAVEVTSNNRVAQITKNLQPIPLAGYRKDIGLFFNGELSSKHISFVAGSRMLELIGIERIKVNIPTAKLAKIITKHTEVTPEILLQVPIAFANPIAIFKSRTVADRFVALTSITTDEGDIVIPFLILSDKKSSSPYLAIITSIYGGKENKAIKWIEEGLLIIGHKKKIHNYLLISRSNCMKAQATMNLYANVEKYLISPDYFNKKINSLEGLPSSQSSNFYLITPEGSFLAKQQMPMVSVNFGAVEVTSNNRVAHVDGLSANGEPIDYSGFQPTYTTLPGYDHLITRALGNTQSVGDQGIKYVLDKCREIAIEGRPQVARLAAHLHSSNPEQAAFNVWHFIKTNIRYATENDEQLRTPARTWADRVEPGVDCDDYATFSAALLLCMGHKPTFEVVGFGKDGAWSHIYTMLGSTVIDPVMNTFNAHPIKITNRMQVHILSGLDGLAGTGADMRTTRAVNQLIAERNRLAAENPNHPEIAKIDFVITKSGSDAFVPWLKLMPWIISIHPETGAITWKNSAMKSPGLESLINQVAAGSEVETALEGFLSGAPAWPASVVEFGRMIDSINSGEMPIEVQEVLQKIKDKKQVTIEELNRVNQWIKAASKDRGTQRELANRNVPIWRRLLRGMAQIDPLLIAARNAFLGLTAVNFRGMAKQMGIGLVTVEEAQRLGWTAAQYMGVKNGWFTFMARWADLGGNPGLLKDRIQTGRGKKPVWGSSDRVKNLYGLGDGGATAAMVTAAASIIGTLMSLVKSMVGSGGKHPDANPQPGAGEQGTPLTENLPENTGTTPAFEWPGNTM